jgi:uncharacterized membrane protein YdjX (TVP38/TMEM64 family)
MPPHVGDTLSPRPRLLAIASAVGAAGLFLLVGGWDLLSDPDRVIDLLRDSGWVGPVVFVLSMWVIQPFGLPGVFFMLPAAVVWPWPVAVVLSWVGNMGASIIAFMFARWFARDWVNQRIPPRIAHYDERFAVGGVWPVILLRVATGQLPPADWFLGVSRVTFGAFFVGTAIGIIPAILVAVVVGGSLLSWALDRPALLAAGLLVAVIAGALWWTRRPPPPDSPATPDPGIRGPG